MKYIILTFFAVLGSIVSFAAIAVAPIIKDTGVCVNATVTLSDSTTGGIWSSSNTVVATIDSSSGMVTGILSGTTTITYTVGIAYVTATVTVNPLPAIDTVAGGGSYCFGGAGKTITLSSSDTAIGYQLYHSGFMVGSSTPGTGSGLTWGPMMAHGTYRVIATNNITGCSIAMADSAKIIINPLPNVDTLYVSGGDMAGGGHYCKGGPGADLYVYPSTTGVTYKLYNGGPIDSTPGITGSRADFGLKTTPGAYIATATNSFGCLSTIIGSPTITIDPLPTPYLVEVTGSHSYCAGGAGVDIWLSSSQIGVTYQLYKSGIPIIAAIAGTRFSLDFGLDTVGIYIITATDAITGCTDTMSGIDTITTIPLPTAITGTAAICAGATTTLSDGTSGGTWSSLGSAVATVNATTGLVTGVSAGTAAIHYNTASCGYTSITVTVNPLPAVYSVSGGGAYCSGGTGAHVYLSGSTAGINYLLYDTTFITTRAGGSGSIDFGLQAKAGNYGVIATNAITGCTRNMAGGATVYVNPAPATYTVTGGGHYCAYGLGRHVGLSGSVFGITYDLYVGSTHTGPTLAGTNTSLDFGAYTAAGVYKVVATNVATGCTDTMSASAAITIDPIASITGTTAICAAASDTLKASIAGGTWSSGNTTIVTVSSAGITSGISAGNASISYTLTTGCLTVVGDTVNPLPAITGDSVVCSGSTITLACPSGGTWATSEPSIATVATIGGSIGVVSGVSPGLDTLTYRLSTGCLSSVTVTVLSLPAVTASASSAACGDSYTLTSTGGIMYSWYPATGLSCDTCSATTAHPTATTTYIVTGSGVTGCTNTDTVTVNGNRISGYIDFSGIAPAALDMQVWLIKYDPTDSTISAPDSTLTCTVGGMGYYEFDGEPAGNYLVKAKLLHGNPPGSSGYMPTYSLSSPHWDSGAIIIHYSGSDTAHITMAYGTVPAGPGFISGNVFAGAGKGTSVEIPVSGMLVFLENEFTNVLTYTYTDANGAYSFSHLAAGNYIIYPEEYLYSTNASAVITLGGATDSATNIDFKDYSLSRTIVPFSMVSGIYEITANTTVTELSLLPNPNNGDLTIVENIASGNTNIIITDLVGREVYRSFINIAPISGNNKAGKAQISLQSLSDGMYLVSVKAQDVNYTGRLVIRK